MADLRTRWHQAMLAIAFLTRLPVTGLLPHTIIPLRSAAWAFPLAGLIVGGAGAAVLTLAPLIGLPPLIAAMLALAAMIRLSGAMHEDGLADLADAAGGTSREQRLEIMRDSRIGSYGVLALLIGFGLRVGGMALVPPVAVVGIALASRAGMVAIMRALPPARGDGLGHAAARPSQRAVAVAVALGLAGLLATTGWLAIPLALVIAAAQALVARRARRMIGGQTGDMMGAAQQLGEIAALLALVCLMGA